jgi:hypothetical protein
VAVKIPIAYRGWSFLTERRRSFILLHRSPHDEDLLQHLVFLVLGNRRRDLTTPASKNTRDYRLVSFGTSAVLLDAPRITLPSAIATSLCDAFTSIDHVHCGVPFLPL